MHAQNGANCAHHIENVEDEKEVDDQTQGTTCKSAPRRTAACTVSSASVRRPAQPKANLSKKR